ncbi:MAG: class I SAM-dependent methyltransferase, partial [Oceanococcus sp.]
YKERDTYRRPYETLQFFGVEPYMTVVELWPGGGWYSEILAPYLKPNGKLYAAHFDPQSSVSYFQKSRVRFDEKLAANPAVYDGVMTTAFDPPEQVAIAPAGSADVILTFRNVHNWYMRGGGAERLDSAFSAMFSALKSGGILGIVDHRLPADRPLSDQDKSGYMHEDFVIQTAEKAGFKLVGRSEINANPLDSANHPKGVWTLPPSLRGPEEDMAKYLSIGESDRMTLKFVKP